MHRSSGLRNIFLEELPKGKLGPVSIHFGLSLDSVPYIVRVESFGLGGTLDEYSFVNGLLRFVTGGRFCYHHFTEILFSQGSIACGTIRILLEVREGAFCDNVSIVYK